ncbi:hypothetical protein NQ315_007871 [Exocentrus adspersus]|uniref:Nuclear RNA export factor 2 n=1 Tax=Exocentrus adspersus TaxID=1586481 RepID=A0AAV8W9F2_9CUCU|nr:hypothetical protein NQ315_007871 [Exocentrus adspersus]
MQRVIINENNLQTGVVYKHKAVIDNINFWHKFVIANPGKCGRDVILRAILDHVHPLDLIPVSYDKTQGQSHFLARNCGSAIIKLAKDNLTVPNPRDPLNPFKLFIILKFATTSEFKIDVQKNIVTVLTKRYDSATRTLNLSNFHTDKGLSEFCPLSQPKIMFFVLHLSKNLSPMPERYILSSNAIKLLNPLESLRGIKGLTFFDLSNNLIESPNLLTPLKTFEITELALDRNPVCDKFKSTYEYIKEVTACCPKVTLLDGIVIKEGLFPPVRTNFLCDAEGFDLVNQFLEYFFTVYDNRNRSMLEGLYHKNAMFSLTAQYIPAQLSSSSALLRTYNNCARNLLKLADFSRNVEYLFRGSTSIIKQFNHLPLSEHDPFSFKSDLIYSTPTCAVINVTGVFRELPQNLLDCERYIGFNRSFVLSKPNAEDEWCIVNEQLHIFNAVNIQITSSFKTPKQPVVSTVPAAKTMRDKQQMADTLKIITNLNTDWSKKCLEECNYDLKKALMLFVDLYKVDRIPLVAFINNPSLYPKK